ncbi:Ldh family oxidoreductase [Halorarum salinum]|uniref:Ldh family oxidoreductase n=1 Tax=Halorarum salinum TaxID=2743089 RepID=A0A7D5QEZ7_9EURY|nr:Ldh family oxidoreductase [Halobaculum salinum]QLG61062.1 Ldh family oxidoreductase [Halobaculum salinum]
MTDEHRADHERLETYARNALAEVGLDTGHAQVVAESLVDADLHGIDTHGVFKLPEYVRRLRSGGMNTDPTVTVDRTRTATAIVDGDDGPGQSVTHRAMDEAIQIADDAGAGFVGVKNSQHFGTAAYFTRQAAQAGCIGICMTHAGQNVVPFGGTEPYFGTNPISISLPREDHFPVTLDMATSVKAKSAVALAEKRGDDIPDTWAIDDDGEPTTDPSDFYALQPLGGPKGYGLAFMVEGFCGILMDTVFGADVPSSYENLSTPQDLAHFVGAINVEAYTSLAGYTERLNRMAEELAAVPTRDGFDQVLVPGEPEHETKQQRLDRGIPFSPSEWEALVDLSETVDLDASDLLVDSVDQP